MKTAPRKVRFGGGVTVFELAEREGWFNRLVRKVLGGMETPRRPSLDLVSVQVTTKFETPDECVEDDVTGKSHAYEGGALLDDDQRASLMVCIKCGATHVTVWRDMPSVWSVLLGRWT